MFEVSFQLKDAYTTGKKELEKATILLVTQLAEIQQDNTNLSAGLRTANRNPRMCMFENLHDNKCVYWTE